MKDENKRSASIRNRAREGLERVERLLLSPLTSRALGADPKHLAFVLSRYKFASKMLADRGHVLEVGCGDSIGASLVAAEGNRVTAIDIEPLSVEAATPTEWLRDSVCMAVHDITEGPYLTGGPFDAVFSLDVIEHIDPEREADFIGNMVRSAKATAPLIIGTPNRTAREYSSAESRYQHINLKTHDTLRTLLQEYYENVFLFGMNDEVVHTGFAPMCQYILALAVQPRPHVL